MKSFFLSFLGSFFGHFWGRFFNHFWGRFLIMFSVLQGARRDSCDDDDCDGGDCDRIIIIDSQWFIIVMILNTVAIAMMAVRWPVMTFHLLIIRGHYMRPAAIRGAGNCQGRMPRGETIFSRIKARIGAIPRGLRRPRYS